MRAIRYENRGNADVIKLLEEPYMPRMSGFELLSIVRLRFPAIAVIAMSGAYSGMAAPQGVAADAFYAKGSSSVAQFLELLCVSLRTK
jgi:CheY-like chemotaxis protein